MFGGVADKYRLYTQVGEPFKEGKVYYVMVRPPFSKKDPIKVRFYADKAHAKNNIKSKSIYKPLHEIFGFKDKNDSIRIVRRRDITTDEHEDFFEFNWLRGHNWKYCTAFGGCWYAPANEPDPDILKLNKIFDCNWEDFKKEMKRLSESPESIWLKNDI